MKVNNPVLTTLTIMNITEILVNGKIALPLREKVGISHDRDGNRITHDGSYLAELFSCFWCTSVWVSAMVFLLYFLLPKSFFRYVINTFAYSWLATYLNEKIQ